RQDLAVPTAGCTVSLFAEMSCQEAPDPDRNEEQSVPATATIANRLEQTRSHTLDLVAPFTDDQLETVHDPIMSPLVWDLGHIAAYEDLWIAHKLGKKPLLHPELAGVYNAFETPRNVRGEIELLDRSEAKCYLEDVRERTLSVLSERRERSEADFL